MKRNGRSDGCIPIVGGSRFCDSLCKKHGLIEPIDGKTLSDTCLQGHTIVDTR